MGVDGGGTKTVARLLGPAQKEDGPRPVLGSGYAHGSNPYSVGWEHAFEAVAQACRGAMQESRATQQPAAIVLAVAGCASESARQRLAQWAEEQNLAKRVSVVPDTTPVLADATPGQPALGLIAGTGSSLLVQTADGEVSMLGGWGYLIGDAGSGYTLGRDALAELVELRDAGSPHEGLESAVCRELQIDSFEGLKPAVYEAPNPRSKIASLAQAVLRSAEQGDRVAARIAELGAKSLAKLAASGLAKLTADDSPVELYLAGALMLRSAYYRGLLQSALDELNLERVKIRLAPDAACGCAQLASKL